MLQPCHRFRLDAETRQPARSAMSAGQDHLQGDGALEGEVSGLGDDAHAAATEHPSIISPGTDTAPTAGSGSGPPSAEGEPCANVAVTSFCGAALGS